MIALPNILGRRTVCAAVAAAVGLIVLTDAAPTQARPTYDGLWSVSIITERGDCDRGYRYPIRISQGRLFNAGDAAFDITGAVAPSGGVRVTVSHGSSSATGIGRLAGNSGGGTWRGGSCSGTWTAERRAP